MADICSDFDGPLDTGPGHRADARPGIDGTPVLVAEVDGTNWGGGVQIIWLFRDFGGGRMEPCSWPDDWPLDISLEQMRARGVEVRE